MSGGELVTAAAAGAASTSLVAVGVMARNRVRRCHVGRAEAHVRPLLFGAIDQGGLDPDVVEGLTRGQQRALETQARSLLPKLRGSDRETLGLLLDRLGAVDAARRQSHSKRAGVRARASQFLGDSGSPTAVHDLVALLHDPDPEVRWSAARGLGRLGHPSALSPLMASLEGRRPMPVDVVADAVCQIRECPVSVLRQGLRSRSVPTRALTVELLGRLQALAGIDDVIELMQHDPSVEVRARAARALGRMGSPRAVEALLASLDDGPVAMRVQAVWALGEIGAPQAVPALRALLLEPSSGPLTRPAGAALAAMGPLGVRVLEQVAESDGPPADTAARALAARHLPPQPVRF